MRLLQVCLILVVHTWLISAKRRRVPFINCPSSNTNSDLITTLHVRSSIECSVICLNEPYCLSASYCRTTDGYTCQLSGFYADGSCTEFVAEGGCSQTAMVNPCENGATFFPQNRTCLCADGFVGDYCQRRYRDCKETPGGNMMYHIQPFGSDHIFEWVCFEAFVMTQTVSVLTYNYTQKWLAIKKGLAIGPGKFFFLGLESLHQLTKQGVCNMSVTVSTGVEKALLWYINTRVDSEEDGYALHWDYFERDERRHSNKNSSIFQDGFGGAGDVTKDLNGARFGTYDNDVNDCAKLKNIGWWYNPLGCMVLEFGPNGPYWPIDRNGTNSNELLYIFTVILWPVNMYVEDDLVF